MDPTEDTGADPRSRAAFVDGPVVGLDSLGPDGASRSGAGGELAVRLGDRVRLSLGELVLGTGTATATMTSVDLDPTSTPLHAGSRAINVARLLQSLGTSPDLRDGIVVTDAHRAAASSFAGRIDFDLAPDEFADDPSVRELVDALGVELRDETVARNHLRRSAHGIKKLGDVAVAMRDGSSLFADVFLPRRRRCGAGGRAARSLRARLRLRPPQHGEGPRPLGEAGDGLVRRPLHGRGRRRLRREPGLGRRLLVGATGLRGRAGRRARHGRIGRTLAAVLAPGSARLPRRHRVGGGPGLVHRSGGHGRRRPTAQPSSGTSPGSALPACGR